MLAVEGKLRLTVAEKMSNLGRPQTIITIVIMVITLKAVFTELGAAGTTRLLATRRLNRR